MIDLFSFFSPTFYYFAEKSGSVAALVDNEQPLSTSLSSIQQRLKQHGPPPPPIPDESLTLVDNRNLMLRDTLTDNNNVQIHHPASSRSLLRQTFTENLYNNVPSNATSNNVGGCRLQPMPGPLKPQMMALELIKNDPSLHVYSNIEEKMHESIDIFLKSGPNRYGGGVVPNSSDNNSNVDGNEALEMDDDLDMIDENVEDDVMTVSDHEEHHDESSFIHPDGPPLEFATSTTTHPNSINNNNTSTSSSSVTTQIDTHFSGFTPVIKSGGNTKFQPSTMALHSPSNFISNNNSLNNHNNNATNSISTSSSVGNASDLDGASSIGNNSQSCLVKPAAIV